MMAEKKKEDTSLPFVKANYLLFALGLFLLVVGYVALSQKPWNSFLSLTLAPILLVLAYCVLIPLAILYKKKEKKEEVKGEEQESEA
jgi:hypothetical protein